MTQRRVRQPVDGGLVWVLALPESLPCHTRPASADALRELAGRYLADPADDDLASRAAGVVARLMAGRELSGPWGE